jgi:hypothetical protein
MRDKRLSRLKWLWVYPVSFVLALVVLVQLIVNDSDHLVLKLFLASWGVVALIGTTYAFFVAIRERNDWLILLCFFLLAPILLGLLSFFVRS